MDEVVALCKRRGLIFPASEIYGGIANTYDYGHYGVLLKRNVTDAWWKAMIQERDDIVALDSAIIQHPRTWEASGHLSGFSDPLVQCLGKCKKRWRLDHLQEAAVENGEDPETVKCPQCGGDLTEPRAFNLMFQTNIGPVQEEGSTVYLRPETAQGIFLDFKTTLSVRAQEAAVRDRADRQVVPQRDHARQLHLPHARVRADGDGVLRAARRGASSGTSTGARSAWTGTCKLGIAPERLRLRPHDAEELSHYSSGTSDVEYLYPIGWSELEGVANRGNFDLTQHAEFSRQKLEWKDPQTGKGYVPHVIEPAAGVGRTMLALLCEAYDEDEIGGEKRTVLRLHPSMAPIKVAVLPLLRKDGHPEKAREIYEDAAHAHERRVRRRRQHRQALPAPGRDRHAVRGHDRPPDARGRHRHAARSRLADAGAGARSRSSADLLERV